MTDQAASDVESSATGADNGTGGAGEDARQASERLRDGFDEHVTGPARRAGEAMRDSGRKAVEGGATISMKLIDQAETNARQAFAALRAAASAKDVSEVMRIQGDYLREQGSRAMEHAREIGDLIVELGKDATSALRRDDQR